MGTVYHSTRDYEHYGKYHSSTHVNGDDDIQDATTAQKGLMTATQASKLNGIEDGADVTATVLTAKGIEDGADVTDATNVAAAGALMGTKAVFAAATELTIATGAVTVTQSVHTIDGESDAADDLDTINGGAAEQLLLIRPASADRDITLKHATGNIVTPDGADYTIPDNGLVLLQYDGANWRMVAGGSTGGSGGLSNIVEDTSPQLGGNLDLHEFSIQLVPAPAADHSVSGQIAPLTCGEAVAFGNLCYIKSDGKAWLADADAATTMRAVCMATESGVAEDSKKFLFHGFARDDSWAWTPGANLYAGTTPGEITATAPSGTGDQVQVVGIATHADRIYFDPSKDVTELV